MIQRVSSLCGWIGYNTLHSIKKSRSILTKYTCLQKGLSFNKHMTVDWQIPQQIFSLVLQISEDEKLAAQNYYFWKLYLWGDFLIVAGRRKMVNGKKKTSTFFFKITGTSCKCTPISLSVLFKPILSWGILYREHHKEQKNISYTLWWRTVVDIFMIVLNINRYKTAAKISGLWML